MDKCYETTKAGKPCQGKVIKDGLCFSHQPKDKPKLYRVKATDFYHNGMVATNWKPEEVREVTPETLKHLRDDAPRNWTILE